MMESLDGINTEYRAYCLNDMEKLISSNRCSDTWNGLEATMAQAMNIHHLETKMDNSKYGNRKTQT